MNRDDLINAKSVIKRTGEVVPFDVSRIRIALVKNALDARGLKAQGKTDLSQHDRTVIDKVIESVVEMVVRNGSLAVHIEQIQDRVELALMRNDERELARSYVMYREAQAVKRESAAQPVARALRVTTEAGLTIELNSAALLEEIAHLSSGIDVPSGQVILEGTLRQCFDGMPEAKVREALLLCLCEKMEVYPDATKLAAGVMLNTIYEKAVGGKVVPHDVGAMYVEGFSAYIKKATEAELLDERLASYDLKRLAAALHPERDGLFDYLGIDTIYDRYLQHVDGRRIELPQWMYMRIAMGLTLNEIDRETMAIQFYEILSTNEYMASTPTLFNSGTRRSQLSSCYLTTVSDDLDGIYEALKENALLSKYAGGLGNDWTRVRALGSHIKGTNGKSQGVVPFLKVVNDTAVAVNQGGKRKGAVCAYLESWHLDIEEFLELRKNTGDDRRRTHDMNTANWIPDLFMKRVMEEGEWTLFSPSTCPDLHDLFGAEFEVAYTAYEDKAARGEIKLFRKLPAAQLWRKMLGMLFETGHPWITFKDPCNVRSPQQHVGVVHSSNLCTEITLNTSDSEIAVCNLGSVNLVAHMVKQADGSYALDHAKLKRTVNVAMRMLDNVIDINYYAVPKARNANLKHRPVGMGIMGFQDCLYLLRTPYASQDAVEFADRSMEAVCYFAYWASTELAEERGRYSSYRGSLWDRGILPQDTVQLLAQARGGYVEVDDSETMDWSALRDRIAAHGMRNSNCVAIAPTATISNIVGVSASIEPSFQNLYVKSNLSGEFTVVNTYLVNELKQRGLWDDVMVADLKYFDGTLSRIDRIPGDLRAVYATAFEVDPKWLVEAASRRQKWIDQAQSLNIYMGGASGKKLDEVYKLAWVRGLKTTYYLRTMAATHVEKSTVAPGALNAVPSGVGGSASGFGAAGGVEVQADGPVCTMRPGDPGFDSCEACQ